MEHTSISISCSARHGANTHYNTNIDDMHQYFPTDIQRNLAAIELKNYQIHGRMVMSRWYKFVDNCKLFERKLASTVAPLIKKIESSDIENHELKQVIQQLLERQKYLEEAVERMSKEKVSVSDVDSIFRKVTSNEVSQIQLKYAPMDKVAESTIDHNMRHQKQSLSNLVTHNHTITQQNPREESPYNYNIQSSSTAPYLSSYDRPTLVYRPLTKEVIIGSPLRLPLTNVSRRRITMGASTPRNWNSVSRQDESVLYTPRSNMSA